VTLGRRTLCVRIPGSGIRLGDQRIVRGRTLTSPPSGTPPPVREPPSIRPAEPCPVGASQLPDRPSAQGGGCRGGDRRGRTPAGPGALGL